MSLFITLEGSEGSGKSTQSHLLQEHLLKRGAKVLALREPGGTPIGEQIRATLHDPQNSAMHPRTEALLYSAARAQLVEEVIRPALATGTIVLCDRYLESTLAYQGYGRGLEMAALKALTQFATEGLRANLVIYLDLPVEVGLERKRRAHAQGQGELTRMDRQALAFYRRVRAGYLAMAAEEPERWCLLDAEQPVAAVQRKIRQRVGTLLAGEDDGSS